MKNSASVNLFSNKFAKTLTLIFILLWLCSLFLGTIPGLNKHDGVFNTHASYEKFSKGAETNNFVYSLRYTFYLYTPVEDLPEYYDYSDRDSGGLLWVIRIGFFVFTLFTLGGLIYLGTKKTPKWWEWVVWTIPFWIFVAIRIDFYFYYFTTFGFTPIS